MRIAVSGAGGFVGSKLIEVLLKNKTYKIIAVTAQTEKYKGLCERVDVVDHEAVTRINWESVDFLVNCAFSMKEDGSQIANALKFVNNLMYNAAESGVGAVINISSQSVYDQQKNVPATEQMEVSPQNMYAMGKYASELLVNAVCRLIPHTNIRLASLIGIGLEQRIINKFIEQAMEGNDIHIVGGKQRFGFLDVRDAVDGLIAIMKSDSESWKETYNLGTNENYTLKEIAECVCKVSSEYCVKPAKYILEPSDLIKNSSLDCMLFQNSFEWRPHYTLLDMVTYIFQYKTSGKLSDR